MCAVLIIDDEKVVLDILKLALDRYGCRAETAQSGEEGISKFDAGDFRAVITDIAMPGIGGFGVLRHIRASRRSATPAIGISGTPWMLEGSDFDSVLAKPFTLEQLFQTLDSVLGESYSEAANA